ncbi:hypothetical protein TCAL_07965 [Tigriopus californicus]|uniref:Rho-GAP domain-containing protein n=1 Tax=Tigriopus californicus TaxID=6832 RepID=A0A553NBA2_TIGCA|nr:rho GTPase-activating protein 44-like [Tigriopus californicus]TRY62697.1 hypothetical protein TCAL_07965 [Tigriopus californicus]|eukprot:TCALIF_07965-PA protein Name:"Similar to Arhgap44 Rho GTPase-activating protein 44 (Rattus norvegicus)" AED:0.13 eAED:0.14 QI:0/0/0/0.5/1/1/2/0/706
MNWTWAHKASKDVRPEKAISAEARLMAIKKAGKIWKKGVEDSLKTAPHKNKNDTLDTRKRRTAEFVLGETVGLAVQALKEEKTVMNIPPPATSPLCTILERFANLEKTIAHMLTTNESEITTFISSHTPLSKLLTDDVPAVILAKKELDQLIKRRAQCNNSLDKETNKFKKMSNEDDIEDERLNQQLETKEKIAFDLDNLEKEVNQENDKLTSTLMTLVSRENRYAESVLELMKLKKSFYENAFKTLEAELPNVQKILQETKFRPVFGERLEDHLEATEKDIAFPIWLAINKMLESGLNDEGLFRISPKQIKLDKFKAYLDSHEPVNELVVEGDVHLQAGLLKSYLRELPVPLLGGRDAYDRWIQSSVMRDERKKIKEFQSILDEEVSTSIKKNIQYVIKFLQELSKKSKATKMTPRNIAIVLGPNLLWSDRGFETDQSNLENIIAIVATMIECYHTIFPVDISFSPDGSWLPQSKCVSEPGTPVGIDGHQLQKSASASPAVTRNTIHLTTQVPVPAPRTSLCLDSPSPNHKRKVSIRSKMINKMKMGGPGAANEKLATLPPPPSHPPPSLPHGIHGSQSNQQTPPPKAPRPTSISLSKGTEEPNLFGGVASIYPSLIVRPSSPDHLILLPGTVSSSTAPEEHAQDPNPVPYERASLTKSIPPSSEDKNRHNTVPTTMLESPQTVLQATATTTSSAIPSSNGATAR